MDIELFDTDPLWDLTALYRGMDDPQINVDLETVAQRADAFIRSYQGRLQALLDGAEGSAALGKALEDYEDLIELNYRVWSYADLLRSAAMDDPDVSKFSGETIDKLTGLFARTLFFTVELNAICDEDLEAALDDPVVARFRPFIEANRAEKPWQLTSDLERLLAEKSTTGREAWNRLFEQVMVSLRIPIGNREVTAEEATNLMMDANPEVRKSAALGLADKVAEHASTFALITNTLARDLAIETEWRGQPDMASSRHINNQVEPEVVATLVSSVKGGYAKTAHRYYALKASWFDQDQLMYWDRTAPLPGDDGTRISWAEAREIVLEAFGGFEPQMEVIARQFFDENWIDAPARRGKVGGAFANPVVPSVHPFVLLNYQGTPRDVMILAHELGHGVHQCLSRNQGILMCDATSTLAETASIFGEMLTFRSLLERAPDEAARKRLIAGKVEGMLGTVVRQISFYDFERRVHGARLEGELTADDIGSIWLDVQRESLGPSVLVDENFRNFWCGIPHFLHSPFMVYAYAFGECLVNALYASYQERPEGFQVRYLEMLAAGGSKRHKELLAPFGLDASRPDFWDKGLSVITGFIDELEAMGT